MSAERPTVGLFDSGLGGLTVLREVLRVVPGARYVYLGDSARAPYGSKSPSTIVRYAEECTRFLLNQSIDLLIVACNTASSHALMRVAELAPVPVIGTVEPAVRAALRFSKKRRIGVIGTEATIASGVYTRAIRASATDAQVVTCACPLFVPLVENGMCEGDIPERVVAHYLAPFRSAQIDTLVLGCTHYPLLRQVISNYLGPEVAIVECSRAIAEQTLHLLGEQPSAPPSPDLHCFVTDEPERFEGYAERFAGLPGVRASKVEL